MPSIARKSRWKFSFRPSSSSSSSSSTSSTAADSSPVGKGNGIGGAADDIDPPPMSFICPISSSLMSDPVIVPPGLTFDRACIQACIDLRFIPPSLLSSSPSSFSFDTSSLIPNAALRAAIIDWCDRLSLPHPPPISHESARALVQLLISINPNPPFPITVSQKETVEEDGVKDCSTANSNPCSTCYSSTSTSSFSSSSGNITSTSSSSSCLDDAKPPKKPPTRSTTDSGMVQDPDPLETSILMKLSSPHVSVKESALISLRHSARDGGTLCRMSLCSPRILAALLPMLNSSAAQLQVNATAAVLNLSIDPPANKVKIVRSGAVPALVEALKHSCSEEARHNAAGGLFSLALEDENKLAVGVLGAIPPLVDLFCQESASRVAREEAGMALYHLSLASNNLSKTSKTPGAVRSILGIAAAAADAGDDDGVVGEGEEESDKVVVNGGRRLRRVAMMVLASLARKEGGRMALMDANAVKAMVGMMEESGGGGGGGGGDGKEEEYCLGVLYGMSRGGLRFRALAKAAGAERVLSQLVSASAASAERGEVAREMARTILKVVRGDHEDRLMAAAASALTLENGGGEGGEDGGGSAVSDGRLVSFGRRRFADFGGAGGSASNSANF